MTQETTDATFEADVLKSELPVLIDFWAPWCGPCRTLGPIMEEIGEKMQGKAKVFKMNVDNNQDTAGKYGIRSIPTVILFRNGEKVQQFVGVKPKESYLEALEQ